jgi:hypothetical protein
VTHATAIPSTTTISNADAKKAEEGLAALILLIFVFVVFLGFMLWILPGIIASKRSHPNAGAIWATTIFLGWTFLGWLAALIWACSSFERLSPPQPRGRHNSVNVPLWLRG